MAKEEVERIKQFFEDNEIEVKYLKHEEVTTSQEAASTRGFELNQGIKSLLFTNDQEYVIVNVPADKKVDSKKVAEHIGWSKNKTRMAKPEEVIEKTGCEIGSVPPLGHKESLKIFYDPKIFENEISTFNIGLKTDSVKIKTEDVKKVFEKIGAEKGDFIK